MTLYDRAVNAVAYIRERLSATPALLQPEIAIVLGSGLGACAKAIENRVEIPYAEIPMFPQSTVEGHAGNFIFGVLEGKAVVAMQGRFHLYEGYGTDDVTLPVRVFQLLGVKSLIVTNAAGAINLQYQVGDFMIIKDHISLFCPSPLKGKNEAAFGTRFPSMSCAYDKEYMQLAQQIADELHISVCQGVYCYCQGPMYETPAEIRALRVLGADAAGMSTVPEVIAAVHGGIKVLGISCMTNMAAGILEVPLNHAEVMETGKRVERDFSKFVREIVARM